MTTDQVFRDCTERDHRAWRVILNGRLLPTVWNSKGAALAGLETERKRLEKRRIKNAVSTG